MISKGVIQVPAQVVDFKPKADRSWKIVFNTRELVGTEVAALADSFQGEGWLVYSPNREITPADIPETPAEVGVKTPAQRLRTKVYILWRELGGKGDFNAYWSAWCQKQIDQIDSKLNGG